MQIALGELVFDVSVQGPDDGDAVLLLHGFPQSSRSWARVATVLTAAGFRTVAPDQRGYSPGARPQEVAAYDVRELARDAVGLLDALELDRAHVVGHDWGAAVAWQLAARHADRVRTLTAVSVPHPHAFRDALRSDPDQRSRSQYMRLFQQPGAEEQLLADDGAYLRQVFGPVSEADHYVQRMQQPGALTAGLNWYRAMGPEAVEGLPPVTVPTLYVWSDQDAALGPVPANATASYVDGPYRFEVLHGVSHWVPEQASEQLAALLLEHLRTG